MFLEELPHLETIQLNLLDDFGFLGFLFADPDAGLRVGVVLLWLKLQIIGRLVVDLINEQLDVGGKVSVIPRILNTDLFFQGILNNRSPVSRRLPFQTCCAGYIALQSARCSTIS